VFDVGMLQVCIDLFVLSQAYTDIATLSTLSHTTGGSLYHYCPFTPVMDQDQLLNDLKWNVSRPQVSTVAGAAQRSTSAH
jgi:protein transport protein SEC24